MPGRLAQRVDFLVPTRTEKGQVPRPPRPKMGSFCRERRTERPGEAMQSPCPLGHACERAGCDNDARPSRHRIGSVSSTATKANAIYDRALQTTQRLCRPRDRLPGGDGAGVPGHHRLHGRSRLGARRSLEIAAPPDRRRQYDPKGKCQGRGPNWRLPGRCCVPARCSNSVLILSDLQALRALISLTWMLQKSNFPTQYDEI